jgi:hypothetical protein
MKFLVDECLHTSLVALAHEPTGAYPNAIHAARANKAASNQRTRPI